MRIITYKPIEAFCQKHADARLALDEVYFKLRGSSATDLLSLQALFPSAEAVGKVTVINVKGNHYRLLVSIHYQSQIAFILEVLTHAEYSKNHWKKKYGVTS